MVTASGDDDAASATVGSGGSGSAPNPPPPYATAWGSIVQTRLAIKDPDTLAKRLRSELQLGSEKRASYAHVLEALDRSARNRDDAARLARAAKLEDERYSLVAAERLEVLRSQAIAELRKEYDAKKRSNPTKQDIEDRMLQNWPVEYRSIKAKIAELHGAMRSLESLRDAWESRSADLRAMIEKVARAPQYHPGRRNDVG